MPGKKAASKRGRGKPQYVPTPADRATVRAMTAAGIAQAIIANCLGTEGIDPKTLRLHFGRELDCTQYEVTATAMSKLLLKIQEGDLGAICFWMKCRAGWSEKPTAQPNVGTPVRIIVEYAKEAGKAE